MVLKQEQTGGPGWWLCSLHGRQGIAPANRLRLLQSTPPPSQDPGPNEDSVYLSPGPPLVQAAVGSGGDDADGVYRAPPVAGEGRGGGAAFRAGELRRAEGGRPRSHSSSGVRARPDWDIGVAGRPRSPSLRGRGTETSGTVYQKPGGALPARQPGVLVGSDSVYLSPTGVQRATDEPEDTTYLVPRETITSGQSDDCYLVPKGTPLASDDVYQSPTGGGVASPVSSNGASVISGTSQSKVNQDVPGMYQTPATVRANPHKTPVTILAHQHPSSLTPGHPSPRPLLKGVPPNAAVARGKPGMAGHRGSPLLVRAGQVRGPGSPSFARKPPPPAPPVRGVTRKDSQQTADSNSAPKPASQASSTSLQQQESKQIRTHQSSEGNMSNGLGKTGNKAGESQAQSTAADDQVRRNKINFILQIILNMSVVLSLSCLTSPDHSQVVFLCSAAMIGV